MQDRQLLELTSQMTVSSTWGSAEEVQFILSMSFFCWDRLFQGKKGERKFNKGKQSFGKKAVLVLESRVVVDLWLTSLGELFEEI